MARAARAGRWQRRSAERPSEIAAAALAEFAARGFAAARLADIAAQAGISKAALYRYYPTKTDLFRAVLTERAGPAVADALAEAVSPERPFPDALARVLDGVRRVAEQPTLRRLSRMVIAESGNFPELATLWRQNVVGPAIDALTALVARAQAQGEVRPGDPRLLALGIMAPLPLGLLWREVMEPAGAAALDIGALLDAHRETQLRGLLARPPSATGA